MMIRALPVLLAALVLCEGQVGITNQPYVNNLTVIATKGPASVTGTVAETNLAALRIPAKTIGRNGALEVRMLWSYPNNANVKTFTVRFSSAAGTTTGTAAGAPATATTSVVAQTLTIIANNNATNSQVIYGASALTPYGTSTSAVITTSIDTTQDAYVNINATLASASDTITLQHASVAVFLSQ